MSKTYLIANNIISSLGFTTQENVQAIKDGRSGVEYLTDKNIYDDPLWAAAIDTERLHSLAKANNLEKYTKLEQLIILSVKDTIKQTNIDITNPELGFIIATTKGNIDLLQKQTEKLNQKVFLGEMATTIASYFKLDDRISVLSNACISGVSALIMAHRSIEAGIYRHVMVVGVDTLTSFITSGFQSFKSVSENICKPYDAEHDGLNIGEACSSILLSKDFHADAIALEGGAISNDANHISGPSRTGDGLAKAIKLAMQEANIEAEDIDCINMHGTATVYNDEMEAKAVNSLNLQAKPTNSLKSYFGHTLGASGVIETIICMQQMKENIVFGTLNYETSGVSVPLNVFPNHIKTPINTCLKTASGFGGCNAAIVLSKQIEGTLSHSFTLSDYAEIAKCSISGSKISIDEKNIFSSQTEDFHIFIREAFKNLGESNQKFYKMDDLSKLGYITAAYLLKDLDIEKNDIALILSNRSSSLDTDIKHQMTIDENGNKAASPATFVYTLPNIVLGEICIYHKIQGENTFFVENTYDKKKLEKLAQITLSRHNIQYCIYGWCEFLKNKYNSEFILLEKR